MAKWEPYDGYRTKQDAINAAKDLRQSLKSWAPDTRVAIRHKANDSLPWQVVVQGRH